MKKNIAEDEWTFSQIVHRQYPRTSTEAIRALGQVAKKWERRKGEAIVEQGELCDRWIFVSKGLHRIMFSRKGKTDTLFFDGGGAIFTSLHSFVAGKANIFRVEAITDSYGWEISHNHYRQLQERYPDLILFELNFMRYQLYSLEDYYKRRALSTPQERYDRFWSKRAEKLQYLAPHILSRFIPLKVIAQYLSMTPQMLSILRRRELERYRKRKED